MCTKIIEAVVTGRSNVAAICRVVQRLSQLHLTLDTFVGWLSEDALQGVRDPLA